LWKGLALSWACLDAPELRVDQARTHLSPWNVFSLNAPGGSGEIYRIEFANSNCYRKCDSKAIIALTHNRKF
jgi:hypothetical protein